MGWGTPRARLERVTNAVVSQFEFMSPEAGAGIASTGHILNF